MNSEQTIGQKSGALRSRLQRLRVPLGFATAILLVFTSQPSQRSIAIGAPIALLGALIRAWASGHV
jgi:hypothetical protein